jgi:hypothetical protein
MKWRRLFFVLIGSCWFRRVYHPTQVISHGWKDFARWVVPSRGNQFSSYTVSFFTCNQSVSQLGLMGSVVRWDKNNFIREVIALWGEVRLSRRPHHLFH